MHFYLLDHEATNEDISQFHFSNQKIGVIVHIEDADGKILLQERGEQARDEKNLYEYIGGQVDSNDTNFKAAIKREVAEEAGTDINLVFKGSIGIYHCLKNKTNWIFIIYLAKYISGQFKIMEPNKCKGYHFLTYPEIIDSKMVTESCKYLTKAIHQNYKKD